MAPAPSSVSDAELCGDVRLQLAALQRSLMGPLPLSDSEIERQVAWAADLDFAPVPQARMLEVNRLALDYFRAQYDGSWAKTYLSHRLGQDPASVSGLDPGYAPAGWTNLVTHLRRLGVTDEEMTETGVATRARTGRLIDRFRDRAVMPILHHGDILGFVGRRNPDAADDAAAGPKYLNTPDTPLFHKGAQLFGLTPELDIVDASLVLVEGPLDAWAVTVALAGRHVGIAPLGTSLTDEQARQIAQLARPVVVATDADSAGRVAAERDYWLLAQHGLDPVAAVLGDGSDPADVLAHSGASALTGALTTARPLGEVLIEERLANLGDLDALRESVLVAAARPAHTWTGHVDALSTTLHLPRATVSEQLADAVTAWNRDPRICARDGVHKAADIVRRSTDARTPACDEWAALADEVDPRLRTQTDWPALVALMQLADRDGHDVGNVIREVVNDEPLGTLPAQDLRYRLVQALPLDVGAPTFQQTQEEGIVEEFTTPRGAAWVEAGTTHGPASSRRRDAHSLPIPSPTTSTVSLDAGRRTSPTV
ncbi:MAG: toprim domain-containing protein [Micrococcales bacterium]|nr:toprim domain-containing protein [Micrococcales bacterium]